MVVYLTENSYLHVYEWMIVCLLFYFQWGIVHSAQRCHRLQNLSLVLWSVLLNNSCQSHPKDDPFSPLLQKSSVLYYENRPSCITKIVRPLLRKSSVLYYENRQSSKNENRPFSITKIVSPLLRKSSVLYYENRQSSITKIVSPPFRKSKRHCVLS